MYKLSELLYCKPPNNGRFYLIAIDGRGGSGKTELTKYLTTLLPGFTFINGDDYFEPIENEISWGRFNDQRFIKDVIKPLKTASSFVYRPYDWHKQPHITEKTITITDGFCLERGYSFLFDLDWDLRIWVEAHKEICFDRGVSRESVPKPRAQKAWQQWQSDQDDYINNYQPAGKADLVIDGSEPFAGQLS